MERIKQFAVAFFVLVVLWFLQPAHAAISAKRSLDMTLPATNLDNVSIADAIDFLRDVTGANIHVNWKALEGVGVGKDTQVNCRLRGVSMRKVLDLIIGEAGAGTQLAYFIDQGVIEVTTRELADKDLLVKIYPVDDLISDTPDFTNAPDFNISQNNTGGRGGGGGGQSLFGGNTSSQNDQQNTSGPQQRAQALIEIITSTVQPEVWDVNGGPAAIRFFQGSLIVTAPRSVHEALGGRAD